jgi:hypothetical protein
MTTLNIPDIGRLCRRVKVGGMKSSKLTGTTTRFRWSPNGVRALWQAGSAASFVRRSSR